MVVSESRRVNRSWYVGCCAIACALQAGVHAQTAAAATILQQPTVVAADDVRRERQDRQNRQVLTDAGISLDESAVATAMSHKSITVVVAAAQLAARMPKSPQLVAALTGVIELAPTAAAVAAIETLDQMKEEAWVSLAVGRMRAEADKYDRLRLALALARSGRGDGWLVAEGALTEEGVAIDAANQIDRFHGLRHGGETIDVLAAIARVRPSVRERRIIEALDFAVYRLKNTVDEVAGPRK